MRVGLHDAEKDHLKKKIFPNLAIMKLSAYHKSKGDEVSWWNPEERYDKVYSSKIFDFTPVNQNLPPDTIRGGTGYRDIPLSQELPTEVDLCYPDYSLYPEYDSALGYLTRGCVRHCPWCVVPEKEGGIRPYRTWQEVVRPDRKNITLMDNNILACDYGISQLEELSWIGHRKKDKYRLDLNQGMDARLVTTEVAEILGRLRWQRHIRFSCDSKGQIPSILKTVELLKEQGVKPWRVFLYILVTEDVDDAEYRVEALKECSSSLTLYAQAERNTAKGIIPNREQKEFCSRYMYSKLYRTETWSEYKQRHSLNY